ncbi:MAG: peptidase m75, imelysin [Crocinitomicaceae bacterium]|nr:peptidase m75, imelysin [Crocinitomicaceae bacterium]
MKKYISLAVAATIAFTACNKDDDSDNSGQSNSLKNHKEQTIDAYAGLVYATYQEAYNKAVEMESAIDAFVSNPTSSTQQSAKDAWLAAREPYGLTEAFRFGDGPIDDEDGPEGLLNAWPLDEGYIDYTEMDLTSGIINDPTNYPTISEDLLESLNEEGGEENVSVGFHAIEFLLWGQDLNPGGDYSNAGQRSYNDYVSGSGATNVDRRKAYLAACASLVVEHLNDMVNEWAPNANNYRADFVADDVDVSLAKIMKGISILSKGELAGERIYVAVDNQDQEDEHSCFSDNTHRDIITNAQGIRNVFFCQNTDLSYSGYSLFNMIAGEDADLAQEISDLVEGSVDMAENMHIPFDEALTQAASRDELLELVANLQQQGDKLVEAGAEVGITISADLPD